MRHEPAASPTSGPDHVAALMFTSGTAGAPRAAMLSHGNLLASIKARYHSRPDAQSRTWSTACSPPFHIFGLNVVIGV